ncbi:cation transport protein-domain-containing protein [Dioszegia hungarica]|uniref:Potassium transport protein n=1 Tax=Dioszegia hungarica TaxID=4972 RepID=A0AA38H425_9TREE|nr:cation transport protein-domain-containing protein [Dioszegia hungarica]KAI9633595.1 cation transport protein-domain-containing protein [Dioszegia hungarica]
MPRLQLRSKLSTVYNYILDSLNFYRIHLLCFTFIPLILSGIVYGISTAYPIAFIDCLFVCVSAMTVTGLVTINLSTLSTLQQVFLFFLMNIGGLAFVSILMIVARLHFFRQKFRHVIEEQRRRDSKRGTGFNLSRTLSRVNPTEGMKEVKRRMSSSLRMGNKVDSPTGEGPSTSIGYTPAGDGSSTHSSVELKSVQPSSSKKTMASGKIEKVMIRRVDGGGSGVLNHMGEYGSSSNDIPGETPAAMTDLDPSTATSNKASYTGQTDLQRTATGRSHASALARTHSLRRDTSGSEPDYKTTGFGGFPTPYEIGKRIFYKAFPRRAEALERSMTMPRTTTVGSRGAAGAESSRGVDKEVDYLTFTARIGRNSRFQGLTSEQIEELGGVEYRALKLLLRIVICYWAFLQLSAFIIIAPYISAGDRYQYVFDAQPNTMNIWFFSIFQSVSAFTNTGMSMADLSLIPFQDAHLMNLCECTRYFLIFSLRLTVWTFYKMVPKNSRTRESLKFLLDHPRRCFVYMFPSTQTYVLAMVMASLYFFDFFFFLVLDIGTPAIDDIPVGTRISAALVQSAAVRTAGFAIVPLAALAPAVKLMYVIMMYIAAFPIAISVRATNVYEERSLGVYGEEDNVEHKGYNEKGVQAVAKYVGWHARRQLAFDMWWLALALWLVCIIERGNLVNPENSGWFNIFNVIFELVSAYGTVGLSLGIPTDNYSFCGSWSTLSKLVVILVMIRGRHRGLPIAIDRAIMLPNDYTVEEEEALEEERDRRSRRGSAIARSSSQDRAGQSLSEQARGNAKAGPGTMRTIGENAYSRETTMISSTATS